MQLTALNARMFTGVTISTSLCVFCALGTQCCYVFCDCVCVSLFEQARVDGAMQAIG